MSANATDDTPRPPDVGTTAGNRWRVAVAIARAELRRSVHRYTATRRKRVLLLVGGIALAPIAGLLLLGAYAAGAGVAAGRLSSLPHVARWWLPVLLAMFGLQGAFLTLHLLEFEAEDLLLSTVPDTTLALGLLGATCWTILVYTGIPLGALFVAFGLGTGSVVTALAGLAVTLLFVLASYLVGTAAGLAARVALLRVPLSSDARKLYGTVLKIGMLVGFGALGSLGGATLGEVEESELSLSMLAPDEPTPIPLGHAADWLFVATPLVDTPGPTAVAAGVVVLALVPLSALVIVRILPRLWYADPTQAAAAGESTTEPTARPSFLAGGRLPGLGRTGVVVDGLFRRARRQPRRLTFVGYYIFVPVVAAMGFLIGGAFPLSTVAGGVLGLLGLWLAGGVFCLNPLGEEGTMVSQLVLADTPATTVVRARLLAGLLVGGPPVAVGSALVALGSLSPAQTLVTGAYWLALVPVSAGLALGIGTLLPNSETRRLLDAIDARAPETLAIIYHALLVLALAVAGPLLALGQTTLVLRGGLAAGVALVALVLGHGGYRFAVSGLADHGRANRPDRVFTLELGVGLALGGLLLSTSAGLGTLLLVGTGGLFAFAAVFVGSYAGWLTVVVAYLLVTGRPEYLDISVPTPGDLWTAALGTVGLLGLWAAVTAAIAVLDVPVARHSLAGTAAGDSLGLVAVLVVLALLVNGPIEELLFRNVIQKRLGEALRPRAALAAASLLFALVHLPLYASGGPVAAAVSMGMLTGAGAVLGFVYDRTGNVVVPALCHGLYNAALFTMLYAA